jgi:hypothetical protein
MRLKERIIKAETKVENKTGTSSEEAFRRIIDDISKNCIPLAHVHEAYRKQFKKSRCA